MAFEKDQRSAEEEDLNKRPGRKKYGRLVRMFREDYLSVCVYKNVHERRTFYDVVIFRKIKVNGGGYDYKRGANLKPVDVPVLAKLLVEVQDFLGTLDIEEIPTR